MKLKNSNKKNGKRKYGIFMFPINAEHGKRRIRDSIRLFAQRISFGKENDANSASHRREEFNIIGVGSPKRNDF